MEIQILSISKEKKQTKAGKDYDGLEVAYKNLRDGAVVGKKLTPFFDSGPIYKALEHAQPGEVYTITQEKRLNESDKKEYWTWLAATKSNGVVSQPTLTATNPQPVQTTQGITTAVKSNYETSEERAKKQVFIIRQSSISNAIDTLSVGSKHVSPDQVIDVAEKYYNYVINGIEVPRDGVVELQQMDDDIPD